MKNINLYSLLLITIGVILQFLVYGSIEPLLVMSTMLFPVIIILYCSRFLKKYEFKAFLLSFSTNFIWTSITAIFRQRGNDVFQLKSDANAFFMHSKNINKELSVDELIRVTDGGGAVFIWKKFYSFFDSWNIALEPYIGIYINCIIVAITAVILIKIVKTIYGYDTRKMLLASYLYAFLGTLWIYGSLHLRDSYILLLMTILIWLIVRTLQKFSIIRILTLIAYSVAWIAFFKYLRIEYKYIPIAAIGIAFAASSFGAKNVISKSAIVLLVVCNLVFIAINYSQLTATLESDSDLEVAKQWDVGNSLGGKYVLNAPIPMRMTLGSFYVHAFPVPAWAGFTQLDSAYHFIKSTTAIYTLFVVPLALAGAMKAYRNRRQKFNAMVIFTAGFYLLFTISVVMTSLEGRHLGSFAAALIILAIYPDRRVPRERKSIKFWTVSWLSAVVITHIGYFILKM